MMNAKKRLVFISCGQLKDEEKQLGKNVCALVSELTPHEPYFAERQSNFDGLTKHILGALDRAVGIITIMHPRGTVHFEDGFGRQEHGRGSVWIEQEIAIAAYITQITKQPLKTAAYIHSYIEREGMREHLLLNPIEFRQDSEVLEHLRGILVGWKDVLPRIAGEELNRVRLRTTISSLGQNNILINCVNDSDEDITIEDFILESEGIVLTDPPLAPTPPNQWTIGAKRPYQINVTFFNGPMNALVDFHRNTGFRFDANVDTVLHCDVRGRYKEFRQTHRIRCNGVQHIQIISPR